MESTDALSDAQSEEAKDLSREAQEKAREISDRARERIAQYTDRAQERVELGRERAASGVERAATLLRERSSNGAGKVGREATEKVAHTVESAAGYLQGHGTTDLLRDVSRYAKQHPWRALIVAVLVGFFFSRVFR